MLPKQSTLTLNLPVPVFETAQAAKQFFADFAKQNNLSARQIFLIKFLGILLQEKIVHFTDASLDSWFERNSDAIASIEEKNLYDLDSLIKAFKNFPDLNFYEEDLTAAISHTLMDLVDDFKLKHSSKPTKLFCELGLLIDADLQDMELLSILSNMHCMAKRFPLYASAGPNNRNIHEFFANILFLKIKCIVCIGELTIDFLDYFSEARRTDKFQGISENRIFTVEAKKQLTKKHVKAGATCYTYSIYYLTIEEKMIETEGVKTLCKRELELIHIPLGDGLPVVFETNLSAEIFGYLKNKLISMESVLVHCKAGLGRTSSLTLTLLSLLGELNDVFAKPLEIKTRLSAYVHQLRAIRPHFVLTPEQLWFGITQAIQIAELDLSLVPNQTESVVQAASTPALILDKKFVP